MEVSGYLYIDLTYLPLILILLFSSTTMLKPLSMLTTNETMIWREKFKPSHVGTSLINRTSGLILKWKSFMPKHIQEKLVSMNGKQRHCSGSVNACLTSTLRYLIGIGEGGMRPSDVITMALDALL